MKRTSTLKLVLAGLFTAMGVVLPTIFHTFSLSGSVFLPMHIPVLLCGLVCGWSYGLASGILVPLISSFVTGMPPLYPVAVSMALELATYGAVFGRQSRKSNNIFASLISAMLSGRAVLGIANVILLSLSGKAYTWSMFISGAFITALPGIIIQLILIPLIYKTLEKSNFLERMS
ncbi:MAG TPA: ECF transporter S component [Clostridiales bacterium]|nr:ECF transporter S component [Clostridiales bacterium]